MKSILKSNIALGVQQILGLLEQQTSLPIAMEFLPLRPANFSSNRNVALHARSLGPPWSKWSYTGHWLYAYHSLLEAPLDLEALGLILDSL